MHRGLRRSARARWLAPARPGGQLGGAGRARSLVDVFLPKAVWVNTSRLNFDNRIDLSRLENVVQLSSFASDAEPEELVRRAQGHEVVILKGLPLPAEVIERFPPSVKLIVEAGNAYFNIDMEAARAKGIVVCNSPAYSCTAVSHLVATFMLNFSCSMATLVRRLALGDLSSFSKKGTQDPQFELEGKTLGIVGGRGRIGSKVAALAQGLSMNVVMSDNGNQTGLLPLKELLRTSDFVSLHCPLTPETRHIINKESIALMKPTSFLINTGRGPLVNEVDLFEALEARTIAGAALDVNDPGYTQEGSPLWKLDNVILTPHIGWKRLESRQRVVDNVSDTISAYFSGRPVNVVS